MGRAAGIASACCLKRPERKLNKCCCFSLGLEIRNINLVNRQVDIIKKIWDSFGYFQLFTRMIE